MCTCRFPDLFLRYTFPLHGIPQQFALIDQQARVRFVASVLPSAIVIIISNAFILESVLFPEVRNITTSTTYAMMVIKSVRSVLSQLSKKMCSIPGAHGAKAMHQRSCGITRSYGFPPRSAGPSLASLRRVAWPWVSSASME